MIRTGLKLWSSNARHLPAALKVYADGWFDYIELFTTIGSFDSTINDWRDLNIPLGLHAPHLYGGFHIAGAGTTDDQAMRTFHEVDRFRMALSPEYVVFHAAENGTIPVLLQRIGLLQQHFPRLHELALIENLPRLGLKNERCEGALPEEMRSILEQTGLRLCLDFGHAISCAAYEKLDSMQVIDGLMALDPAVFHLSDGHAALPYDEHLNLGEGDYPLAECLRRVPGGKSLTLETKKKSEEELDDFVEDVRRVRREQKNAGKQ